MNRVGSGVRKGTVNRSLVVVQTGPLPGSERFTTVALVVLGIPANTAIFSVVNAVKVHWGDALSGSRTPVHG